MPSFGLGPLPNFPITTCGALAQQLESLGFDALWIPDERFYRDVTVTLSAIAQATTRLHIGTAVTDPFIRHPGLTAQWTASLDELSQGRMRIGIGAGIAGFDALGIERERPALAIREMVTLMRRLWTAEQVTYQGETVAFNDASLDFRPYRSRIPCYIAGRGPLILKLAGKIGDGVIIGSLASDNTLSYALDRIDAGLQDAGRTRDDIDIAIWLHTAVDDDREQAQNAVREIVVGVLLSSRPVLQQLGVHIDSEVHEALEGLRYEHGSPEMQRVAAMLSSDVLAHFSAAGTPSEVAEHIQALRDAGVNHFALKPWLVPGQTLGAFAQRVAEEVIPMVT